MNVQVKLPTHTVYYESKFDNISDIIKEVIKQLGVTTVLSQKIVRDTKYTECCIECLVTKHVENISSIQCQVDEIVEYLQRSKHYKVIRQALNFYNHHNDETELRILLRRVIKNNTPLITQIERVNINICVY